MSEWHKLCSICPYGELKYNLQKKQTKADGDRIEELEKIDAASQARIQELEIGVAFLTDAIENGDEIEFIPEKKS